MWDLSELLLIPACQYIIIYNYLKLKSLNKKREEGRPKEIDFYFQ